MSSTKIGNVRVKRSYIESMIVRTDYAIIDELGEHRCMIEIAGGRYYGTSRESKAAAYAVALNDAERIFNGRFARMRDVRQSRQAA